MSEKRCDGCVYYRDSGDSVYRSLTGKLTEIGLCKIGPPENKPVGEQRWPQVFPDEDCGCHTAPPGDDDLDELMEGDDGGGVVLPLRPGGSAA